MAAAVTPQAIIGMVGWSFDYAVAATASTVLTGGQLTGVRVHVPLSCTATNIEMYIGAAGVTLTAGQCFAALYDATTGVLLGLTADQATVWQSAGRKSMPIAGGPLPLAAGFYDVAWWANGATPPGVTRGQAAAVVNMTAAAANSRFWTADTGLTTTAPSPRATRVASSFAWWAGLS